MSELSGKLFPSPMKLPAHDEASEMAACTAMLAHALNAPPAATKQFLPMTSGTPGVALVRSIASLQAHAFEDFAALSRMVVLMPIRQFSPIRHPCRQTCQQQGFFLAKQHSCSRMSTSVKGRLVVARQFRKSLFEL